MSSVSRRSLFGGVGALGASALARGAAGATPPTAAPTPAYRFFNAEEAAFVEPAVDRLIPPDERWPGAREAGVPTYIDQQLAGAYGQGARLYAAGPWEPGTPSQGYQLPLNPSQLYRTALAAIARELAGKPFGELPPEQQDAFLTRLEQSQVPMEFPSAQFFDTLLANTIEGFFADPMYGGNRDMVGWRMIGFPGAYAAYLEIYTSHGLRFDREPMSIGSPGHGSGMHTGAPRHG
jgi:gluconate 2-dehydrogenase gamma chain